MQQINITQTKSTIGQTQRQKKIMQALGLKKIGCTVTHTLTPTLQGMVSRVRHLINTTPIK